MNKSSKEALGVADSSVGMAALAERFAPSPDSSESVPHSPPAEPTADPAPYSSAQSEPPAERLTDVLTDVGNGCRFAKDHGDRVRFIRPWRKWAAYDGRRWDLGAEGKVQQLAKQTAKSVYALAAEADGAADQKRITDHARSSQTVIGVRNMLAAASSEPPIDCSHEGFDADPWVMNTPDGTIDLKTGRLRGHDAGDLLMKMTACGPAEEGDKPERWLQFLEEIFAGDAALIEYVQRLLGAALIGQQIEHVFPVFHGSGANGKSVLLRVVGDILGNYAATVSRDLLMSKAGNSHPTELADLHGLRLAVCQETDDGHKLNAGLMKSITGNDIIKARRMREDFWQFKPTHTIVLATNHRPEVSGTDAAVWRRLRLVPFGVVVPEDQRDPHLATKIVAEEGPGVLSWLVAGCLAFQADGLPETPAVAAATDDYRADSDPVGQFLDEYCVKAESAHVKSSLLNRTFSLWAEEAGEPARDPKQLKGELHRRGIESKRRKDGAYFIGIGLLAAD